MKLEDAKDKKEILEHVEKMKKIKSDINNTRSKQRYLQLMKCYHKLEKQLAIYLNYSCEDIYIKRGD